MTEFKKSEALRAELAATARVLVDDGKVVEGGLMFAAADRIDDLALVVDNLRDVIGATPGREADELEAAPAAKPARCKHDWDTSKVPPVCKKCGQPKSPRGRKNADPAANIQTATVDGTTKIDPPSHPLPLPPPPANGPASRKPLGNAAADKYDGGAVGGPGK